MIKVDENYFITADKYGFQLVQKYKTDKNVVAGRKTKEDQQRTVGYYTTLIGALNAYRKANVLSWVEHDRMTFDALITRITELDQKIMAKMKAKGLAELEVSNESKG